MIFTLKGFNTIAIRLTNRNLTNPTALTGNITSYGSFIALTLLNSWLGHTHWYCLVIFKKIKKKSDWCTLNWVYFLNKCAKINWLNHLSIILPNFKMNVHSRIWLNKYKNFFYQVILMLVMF